MAWNHYIIKKRLIRYLLSVTQMATMFKNNKIKVRIYVKLDCEVCKYVYDIKENELFSYYKKAMFNSFTLYLFHCHNLGDSVIEW